MHTTPRIESLEAILVDLPIIREHRLAMATMRSQTLVIVRLRCDDGIEGVGEATSIGGLRYGDQSPEGIKLALDYLAPLLADADASNVNATMHMVGQMVQGHSFAKSAVETALLDAQGQRLGVPVHDLLGGAVRTSLPVLWTLATGDLARDVAEAQALIASRRHRAFKLKIGRGEPGADVAHAVAIKRALGDDTCVTVDVNQAWDEVTATRGMTALEAAGIDLVEQPISRRHRRGMARLAARFAIPIMADESLTGPEDAFELATDAAADVFSLKISKAGGPLATLRTAAVASAAGIALYGGTMLEGSVGTIASAHTFAACAHLPWGTELFGPLLLQDDVVVERPTYREFELELPRRPGLGVQLDEDKLAFYRRDRQRTTIPAPAVA